MLVLGFAILLTACQSAPAGVTGQKVQVNGGVYRNLTADELNTLLKNKGFVFVNVHIPFAGNIAGTDLSIPYDTIAENLAQLPADKSAKIVTAQASWFRGAEAACSPVPAALAQAVHGSPSGCVTSRIYTCTCRKCRCPTSTN